VQVQNTATVQHAVLQSGHMPGVVFSTDMGPVNNGQLEVCYFSVSNLCELISKLFQKIIAAHEYFSTFNVVEVILK